MVLSTKVEVVSEMKEFITKHIRSIVEDVWEDSVNCYRTNKEIALSTCRACDFHDGLTYSKRAIKCTMKQNQKGLKK